MSTKKEICRYLDSHFAVTVHTDLNDIILNIKGDHCQREISQ
jgi:hypothetical protein